ncbi:hypothetical protein ACQCSX_22115 (plasmid) [Pseudarthrobacter sp. P1]|uniref:hypothetical protein n=1 Tax=Pseudarthrobacter sp. P1 TaxID=3418418 RepID=UPI003CF0B324
MSAARHPGGIPAGGQFAATAHAEPGVALHAGGSPRNELERGMARWAALKGGWDREADDLQTQSERLRGRRGRLAGAGAANTLLTGFPRAAVLTYTRNTKTGLTELDGIYDASGASLLGNEDLSDAQSPNRPTREQWSCAERSVRHLEGTSLPNPEAQGISSLGDVVERLHLDTALEDALAYMGDEGRTPAQASNDRMRRALQSWSETVDDPQTTFRDLLTDMRHYANGHGIDLDQALEDSRAMHAFETTSADFTGGR